MASDSTAVDIDPPAAPAAPAAKKAIGKPKPGATGKPKDRFIVSKWNAVAMWAFDMAVDNCAICKHHVTELCMKCLADSYGNTNQECAIAWGACNHAFHFHCISEWLKGHNFCPLDNRPWELQKYGLQ